jgi:hypothetical protein
MSNYLMPKANFIGHLKFVIGHFRLALSLFVFWVFFADHKDPPVAFNDLAILAYSFDRCSDLHMIGLTAPAIDNPSFGVVVGTHLHRDLVARQDLYPKHPQFARQVAKHCSSVR